MIFQINSVTRICPSSRNSHSSHSRHLQSTVRTLHCDPMMRWSSPVLPILPQIQSCWRFVFALVYRNDLLLGCTVSARLPVEKGHISADNRKYDCGVRTPCLQSEASIEHHRISIHLEYYPWNLDSQLCVSISWLVSFHERLVKSTQPCRSLKN